MLQLDDVPEIDRDLIAPAYYAAKLAFGFDLTPVEAYMAYTYLGIQVPSMHLKKAIAVKMHKMNHDIGTSWLHYFLFNAEVLYSDATRTNKLFAGLSPEQKNAILDMTSEVYTIELV